MKRIEFSSNKFGFLLLDTLIGILIFSLLIGVILNQLSISTKMNIYLRETYNNEMDLSYSKSYIEDEILRADEIISTKNIDGFDIKFKENIGIIGVNYSSSSDKKYYFSYYKYKDELRRIACQSPSWKKIKGNDFKGFNTILWGVDSLNIDKKDDGNILMEIKFFDDRILNIHFKIKNKKRDF